MVEDIQPEAICQMWTTLMMTSQHHLGQFGERCTCRSVWGDSDSEGDRQPGGREGRGVRLPVWLWSQQDTMLPSLFSGLLPVNTLMELTHDELDLLAMGQVIQSAESPQHQSCREEKNLWPPWPPCVSNHVLLLPALRGSRTSWGATSTIDQWCMYTRTRIGSKSTPSHSNK